MENCKHCGYAISRQKPHRCHVTETVFNPDDDDSFIVSAAVAAATDSTLLGTLAGGDLLSAMIGDALNDSDSDDDGDSGDD